MQFPYDIWNMIMSYLPVGQVQKLYSVNGALFDIAMDLRYKEARLWTGGPKARVRKDLRVFRHPPLSARPKTLHIDLNSIAKSLSPLDREGLSLGTTIFNLVTTGEFDQPGSVPEIFAIALDALPRFTAVTKLSIVYNYTGACRDDPLIRQLITHIWMIFEDRLQFLQVQVALENLELLLPTSLHLPNLEILAINAEGYSRVTANAAESIISTVIQSHSSSLRDVSFTTKNTAIDFQHIFRTLQYLPHLRAIRLSLPFGPFVPRPFPAYELLYSCRHHLEVLSLNFVEVGTNMDKDDSSESSVFGEGWSCVDLPHVKDLRINPPVMVFGQEFVEYIHRFAPSLISFSIDSNLVLRYHEAEKLSSIFHAFFSLRNLSICTRYFCPDILALLARTLPHLQTLNLRYSCISPTTDQETRPWNIPEIEHLFYSAMQQHTDLFREWRLVSLDHAPFSNHSPSAPIQKALTDHLPNVEWFCGVERSTYLRLGLAKKRPPTAFSPAAASLAMLSTAGRFINNLTSTD